MAKNKSDNEALEGHEKLTMADQMRANGIGAKPRTSPVTGAVENPRREYMKARIAYRAKMPSSAC